MADGLQFDRAQFASGNHCTICQNPLQDSYFRLLQDTVCATCAEKARLDQQFRLEQGGGLLRAALFGIGAALLGSAIYGAVVLLTGYEFALIAILIGWMVGKAMMNGSRGVGGRRFQVVAVLITYLSITGGYVPSIVKELAKNQDQEKAKGPAAKAAEQKPEQKDAAAAAGPGTVVLALAVLLGIAAIAPILNAASVSGVIGLVIIAVGLGQAWKQTAETAFLIEGPFPFTPVTPADPATSPPA